MSAKQKILIKGPTRLSGKVTPIANKNSIMAALPVCLLTKYDVIYQNLPKTSDVQVMLEILQRLGAKVVKDSQGKTIINTKNIANYEIPTELSSKNRASIMFLGPLFARFGQAEIGEVGGCKLGKRPFTIIYSNYQNLAEKQLATTTSLVLKKQNQLFTHLG